MTELSFLAIDLGAESGRGVLAEFDGAQVTLREIGRFRTGRGEEDTCRDGVQRWDLDRIHAAISEIVGTASDQTSNRLSGIGVDSWGVDFGLFDAQGVLLDRPVCYRDRSHVTARDSILRRISDDELWDETGIQGMAFNTLYQIEALARRDPHLLEQAHSLLLMPDVIHNLLIGGGHRAAEMTDASTTQMMKPGASEWNFALLERLGLPSHFLVPAVPAGTRVGVTPTGVPVYAPATHDTASAVVATPCDPEATAGEWAYLSSGTWSLAGLEIPKPILDREAKRLRFSNEGGAGGTTRFLKNIMGLWLVQQSRRAIETETGREYSYAELTNLAGVANTASIIDAVDDRFLNPHDMVAEIQAACRETGQPAPATAGEIVRCCLESLALAYRHALRDLGNLFEKPARVLHIVGGGSQNALLNQWTADACGIPVLAGPSEATALGNVLSQMVPAGVISGWKESQGCFLPIVYTHRVLAARKRA